MAVEILRISLIWRGSVPGVRVAGFLSFLIPDSICLNQKRRI